MKIVFVCTGNTCRSPMLKFLFEDYLKRLGDDSIVVDSAGTMDHAKPMSCYSEKSLETAHVKYGAHISKFCSRDLVLSADAVICVSREHKAKLSELYAEQKNIYSLYDICGQDIPDPYGLGQAAYDSVLSQMQGMLGAIYDFTKSICK